MLLIVVCQSRGGFEVEFIQRSGVMAAALILIVGNLLEEKVAVLPGEFGDAAIFADAIMSVASATVGRCSCRVCCECQRHRADRAA